ncbi:MAG: intradiol ring-cleavage dioxygenase [Cyclobacteriaceae bacterium]|nr:intradiol ring-cleavage dioxygenase [Cyclobacteriaceae bacterium]
MRAPSILILSLMLVSKTTFSQIVGGGCDGCELMFDGIPKTINSADTTLAWKNSHKKLIVSGIIYQPDGKTPARDVILYYYHTNAKGVYASGKNQIFAKRHGELRGWVKTGTSGEYKIFTIEPAPYPNEKNPAHIHMTVKESKLNEYYIDDLFFDEDPLLTTALRNKNENRGGSGVMIIGEKNGVHYAERNITLGLHIPNYPVQKQTGISSGLSVGESCPAFDPYHVSGKDKGTNRCPMCSYGFGQGVMIWWNSPDLKPLMNLLKNFEPIIEKSGSTKLRVFAMYTNPDKKSEEELKLKLSALANVYQLKNCALTFVPSVQDPETSKLFLINPQALNTIFIYRKRKVIDKFINIKTENPSEILTRLEL